MRKAKPLTASRVARATCPQGQIKVTLTDSHFGLFLRVVPTGSKTWYVRRREHGKDTSVKVGTYPDIDLKEARRLAAIKAGESAPVELPDTSSAETGQTFGHYIEEYLKRERGEWRPTTRTRQMWLAGELEPFRKRPVSGITRAELKTFLLGVAEAGHPVKAKRLCGMLALVLDDALDEKAVGENVAKDLVKKLPTRKAVPHPAIIERRAFGQLLRDIDRYDEVITGPRSFLGYMLRLMPLVALRTQEVRFMRWCDLDLAHPDGPRWNVPAATVKTDVALIVPLARQSVAIIEQLVVAAKITPAERASDLYVFEYGVNEVLSENAANMALERLGYRGKHSGHGFRSSFSTLAHEQGWEPLAIELAIGHKIGGVKGVYMRGALLEQRRVMAQKWADLCDAMKAAKS